MCGSETSDDDDTSRPGPNIIRFQFAPMTIDNHRTVTLTRYQATAASRVREVPKDEALYQSLGTVKDVVREALMASEGGTRLPWMLSFLDHGVLHSGLAQVTVTVDGESYNFRPPGSDWDD